VIHAVHTNNMSEMGGLRKRMPITFWTFLIGSLALAGVPPLAGFWSKDELLVVANEGGHDVMFVVLLLTALLTAFYMTRAVLMTFFGEFRGHGEPHEGPRTMTGVLVALATVTVFVGLLGAPQLGAPFGTWVFFHEIEEALFVPWIAVASTLAALLGIAIGYRLYNTYRERDPIRSLGPAYTVLTNKYYLDDLYWKGIVRPVRDDVSAGVYWNDRTIIDGVVNGAASFTKTLGNGVNWFDEKVIDGAVNGLANLAGFTGGLLRYIQSGNVQRYAVFLFAGVVVLAVIFTKI
jgi:NADH-quinone oxidoreductase subunit L